MCERLGMEQTPTTAQIASAMAISKGHASGIVTNNRPPSRALAIQIYRKIGWKASPIANLTDEEIDALEQIEAKIASQVAA
jgi:plasmid maintenance system antidote protein VapI